MVKRPILLLLVTQVDNEKSIDLRFLILKLEKTSIDRQLPLSLSKLIGSHNAIGFNITYIKGVIRNAVHLVNSRSPIRAVCNGIF